MDNNDITYFAETNFRNQRKKFGIKMADRRKHTYIIGKTGMGKTTLLENMAIQDIASGRGVGIVDPHGEFAEKMLSFVPKERIKDVIYFNPSDTKFPIAFNPMEEVQPDQRHLVASGLLGVFKKIWPDVWSPRMEYLLSNAILALLEIPGSTLLGINRMFAEKDFRKQIVSSLSDPVVKAFWEKEYAQYQERFATEASAAIQNKVGQFISNPLIRNIIGQPASSFDIRKTMDEEKILIMNLSKGKIGEENSRLLGAMLVTKIYLTAMTRVDIPREEDRKDFYLYVDEFQNFATESFASILSEARKYRLNLTLAHQYVAQMDETVSDAVFGNVGSMISFRVGAQDAELLEKEFSPEFMIQDLVNLGFAQIYLKLMIDGVASRPFSATTLAPYPRPEKNFLSEIFEHSQGKYGMEQVRVEESITKYFVPEKREEKNRDDKTASFRSERPIFREDRDASREVKRKLFEAKCAVDGKPVLVPFEPDVRRPVYCQEHLEMIKRGEMEAAETRRGARGPEIRRQGPDRRPEEIFKRPQAARASTPAVRYNESVRPISLSELVRKEEKQGSKNMPDTMNSARPPDAKASINYPELRKVLDESLKKNEEEKLPQPQIRPPQVQDHFPKNARGVIRPGQSIRF